MKLIRSIGYALAGIGCFFKQDRNGQLQLVVALASITAGWLLQIPPTHWMILIACITAVLSLEMVNASLEKLCDLVEPSIHPQIKLIKDLAAGAVLLAAITSVIIGFFLFLPAVRHLL